MSIPTWYLGPAGDLRALPGPEKDVEVSPVRYGGVHQGLSGARSVDQTGVRMEYGFRFEYLDPADVQWFEALHYRMVPGPFRLIDPRKVNRLTPEAAMVKVGGGTARGAMITGGTAFRAWDAPTPKVGGVTAMSTRWVNNTGQILRLDQAKRITLWPNETLVFSFHAKAATSGKVIAYGVDYYDRDGNQVSGSANVPSQAITTTWTRYWVTHTPPAGAVTARTFIWPQSGSGDVFLTAAQFEGYRDQVVSPTIPPVPWEQGGGSPIVHIDEMSVTSPRFPYTSINLKLLEA
jgi:hypothetical protein